MFDWLPTVTMVVAILFACVPDSNQLECFEIDSPTWRVFQDIDSYRNSDTTFDVHVLPISNWVRINQLPSAHLQPEQFRANSSRYIVRMDLSNLGIDSVVAETFKYLSCMRNLELQMNRLTTLPAGALEAMTFLRHLNLSENRISHIDTNMFGRLNALRTMDLSLNLIHSVADKAFLHLPNLQLLNFSSNVVVEVDFENWGLQTNLINLNMSQNSLQFVKIHTKMIFEHFTRFDLSHNRLDYLDVPALKEMAPNMALLFIQGNKFHCAFLEHMVEDFARFHFFHRSKNETFFNVDGIDCIGRFDEDITQFEKDRKDQLDGPTTYVPVPEKKKDSSVNTDEFLKTIARNNLKVLEAIHSLRTIIVFLFVFVLIFMCVNVFIRSGFTRRIHDWARPARRSQLHEPIDNSQEVENFRLIQANV